MDKFSSVRDNCGIALAHSLEDAYDMAHHQNNRGQDTAGIGYLNPRNGIYTVRWHGKVHAFNPRDLNGLFRQFDGGYPEGMYISHVKYTTIGSKDPRAILEASHPHYIGNAEDHYRGSHLITVGPKKIIVHNGTIVNEPKVREDVSEYNLKTDCDTEAFLAYCDKFGLNTALNDIPAAYCVIILDTETHTATAMRGRHGIRPLWRGHKNGKTVLASEDTAIRKIGGIPDEEVMPGSITTVYPDGTYETIQVMEPSPKPCVFEWIYIMDYDSTFYGRVVRDVQVELGRQLYIEFGHQIPKGAIVVHIPHRPEIASMAFAEIGSFDYLPALYKMSDERAFLQLTQEQRELSIRRNLYLDPIHTRAFKGRPVVIVDDSIVRGTNAPYAVELIKSTDPSWIGFLSYAPMLGGEVLLEGIPNGSKNRCTACFTGVEPIPLSFLSKDELALTNNGTKMAGCKYGVAMPPSERFITALLGRDTERIRKHIGVDFLGYLSLEGMERATKPIIPVISSSAP